MDSLLTHVTNAFGFLSRALAPAPLRRITRAVLATISSILWDNVLNRYRFSTAGAAQFHADLAAICKVFDKVVGPGIAEIGLRKCLEGAQLVGLPVKGDKDQVSKMAFSSSSSSSAAAIDAEDDADDDWDAWAAGDDEDPPPPPSGGGGDPLQQKEILRPTSPAEEDAVLGLWEVEKRLFADNQSARDVLEVLGLEVLNETEARALLRRRVELTG